jgi:hypothetical protein
VDIPNGLIKYLAGSRKIFLDYQLLFGSPGNQINYQANDSYDKENAEPNTRLKNTPND